MTGEPKPAEARWDDYTPQSESDVYDISDKPNYQCGLVALSSVGGASLSAMIHNGLLKVQHRGQDAAGLAIHTGEELLIHKDVGLVDQAITARAVSKLPKTVHHGMGHTRYSTSAVPGKNKERLRLQRQAAHPIYYREDDLRVALLMNGHVSNHQEIMSDLGVDPEGVITDTDGLARSIMHVRKKTQHSEDALYEVLSRANGAYSLAMMDENDRVLVARDPHGFRPLWLGRRLGDGWAVASETGALPILGAPLATREIDPGELLEINGSKLFSRQLLEAKSSKLCLMELIYLTSPDSELFGSELQQVRQELGRRLAKVAPVDADIVIGVPDSGVPAAIGYSRASETARPQGLVKNPYVARTFIEDGQINREEKARKKYRVIRSDVEGKRVVVVDDSLVRGTTTRVLVEMLREAGAAQVHLRISSPPYLWPCFYGLDTGTRDQLIGAQFSHLGERDMVDSIRRVIGADSLAYLGLEETVAAATASADAVKKLGQHGTSLVCTGCFSGDYPTDIPESWLELSISKKGMYT